MKKPIKYFLWGIIALALAGSGVRYVLAPVPVEEVVR
jgi:hypothetical protein